MSRISLAKKLLLLLIAVGLIPAGITAIIGIQTSSRDMEDRTKVTFGTLAAARDNKAAQLEQYLAASRVQVDNLASTAATFRDLGFQKLEAVRTNRYSAVASYFDLVQNQARTLARSEMVQRALVDCNGSFQKVGAETGRRAADSRRELGKYYSGQFGATYSQRNEGRVTNTGSMLKPLDDEAIIMQATFISGNPHPLGEKHQMDDPDDGSSYARAHARIHPYLRDYLEEFGYYDIFLVDGKSGDIVYSVFKELDFATSLRDGPYAQTSFGRSFRKIMNEAHCS